MRERTGTMKSSAPLSLRYWPAVSCLKASTVSLSFTCWFTQPASKAGKPIASTRAPARRCAVFMTFPSTVIGAPLCLISRAERKEFFEQLGIGHARRLSRLREIFFGREIGIRVGLDDVDLPVGVHAVVDACATRETERAIDAAREFVESCDDGGRKILGFMRVDAV